MNNNRYIILLFGVIIILACALVGLGVYINTTSSEHIAKLSSAHYAKVRTVKAAYQNITPTIKIPSIHLTSAWMLDIHVKLDGTLTNIYVQPGDKVKKGQILGEIENDELPSQILQVEGNISGAQANYIRWENAAKRNELLVKSGAVSLQQMEESVANRDAAAAEVASNKAQREQLVSRLKNRKIISPQDGDVLKAYHSPGVFLNAGQPLVMIGDFSTLFVHMNMSDEKLKALFYVSNNFKLFIPHWQCAEKAYAANFKSSGNISDFDLILAKIDPPMEEDARYRSVVWQVANKSSFLEPATYYQVKIYVASPKLSLAIPQEALLEKQDSLVFVVNQGQLEQRQIKTGVQDDYFIEVLEGLKENEVVVISGKIGLTAGDRVQSID